MTWFSVSRDPSINRTMGGTIIHEELAWSCEFACPGVQLVVGDEEVWMSRDEALDLATALLSAARDT